MLRPIIFDFDGVIVDSEILANRALAACLTANGLPTTMEESFARYAGMRLSDCIAAAERFHGRALPRNFAELYRAHSLDRLQRELKPVPGAPAFVREVSHRKTAIASSSSVARIKLKLELVGLGGHFTDHIYSADDIARGKPHPDIFLKAAHGLQADPQDCIVIEDGTLGVQGAVAAGMTVIGLTAASHCDAAHGERLLAVGAHTIARTYDEVAAYVACV
jgi:HAD superfamily hydrolase (TIGR01509 family)